MKEYLGNRRDQDTGRYYTKSNIPFNSLRMIANDNGIFKIMPEHDDDPDTCWYGNHFLGERYAVFEYHDGFYQQVTNWYKRYGYAVKRLKELAGNANNREMWL